MEAQPQMADVEMMEEVAAEDVAEMPVFAAASAKFELSKYKDFMAGMDEHLTGSGIIGGEPLEESKTPVADAAKLPKPKTPSIFDNLPLTKPPADSAFIPLGGPTDAQLTQRIVDSVPKNHGQQMLPKPQVHTQPEGGQGGGQQAAMAGGAGGGQADV